MTAVPTLALALAAALAAAPAPAPDAAARLAEANALQEAGDVEGATRAYEALLADGLESPALHVNAGSAHLRAGRRGAAIASFERALRLDPRDGDARANLALARGRSADRLLGADRPFLARVVERTPDGWAAAALAIPWIALWALLGASLLAGARGRAALRSGAILAAVAAAVGAALVLGREAERRLEVAVVIRERAPVRDGPEEALRPALHLAEGTAVRVVEARGEAVRVRLASGRDGWVRARDLERL